MTTTAVDDYHVPTSNNSDSDMKNSSSLRNNQTASVISSSSNNKSKDGINTSKLKTTTATAATTLKPSSATGINRKQVQGNVVLMSKTSGSTRTHSTTATKVVTISSSSSLRLASKSNNSSSIDLLVSNQNNNNNNNNNNSNKSAVTFNSALTASSSSSAASNSNSIIIANQDTVVNSNTSPLTSSLYLLIKPQKTTCKSEPVSKSILRWHQYKIYEQNVLQKVYLIQQFLKPILFKYYHKHKRQKRHRNSVRHSSIFSHNSTCAVSDVVNTVIDGTVTNNNYDSDDEEEEGDEIYLKQDTYQQLQCIMKIQKWFRNLHKHRLLTYKSYLHNIQLINTIIIQKYYRRYYTRKRTNKKISKLYYFYEKISSLFRKYILITGARHLHSQILLVQSIARKFNKRNDYIRMKNGFRMLQRRFRRYYKRRLLVNNVLQHIMNCVYITHTASKRIVKNYQALVFNKKMSKFVLYCAHHYHRQYILRQVSAIVIQKVYRGFILRLHLLHAELRQYQSHCAAILIQKIYRGRKVYHYHRNIKRNWRRFYSKWIRLYFGRIVLPIQRMIQLYLFRCRRYHAAIKILLHYRIYQTKRIMSSIHRIKSNYTRVHALKILQRSVRRFIGKKRRFHQMCLEHMAVYKIQHRLQPLLAREILRNRKKRHTLRIYEEIAETKRMALIKRQHRAVETICMRAFQRHAFRIQKAFHNWRAVKNAYERDQQRTLLRNRRLDTVSLGSLSSKDSLNEIIDQSFDKNNNNNDDDVSSVGQHPDNIIITNNSNTGNATGVNQNGDDGNSISTLGSKQSKDVLPKKKKNNNNKRLIPPLLSPANAGTTTAATRHTDNSTMSTTAGTAGDNHSLNAGSSLSTLGSMATLTTSATNNTTKVKAREKRKSMSQKIAMRMAMAGNGNDDNNAVPMYGKNSNTNTVIQSLFMAKNMISSVANALTNGRVIITSQEKIRLKNAILTYHSRSLAQEGVEDLWMTIGADEETAMQMNQDKFILKHHPYFVKIPVDLSGESKLLIYIWKKRNKVKNCLCGNIDIINRPKAYVAPSKNQERIRILALQGIKLISNPNILFEIHAPFIMPVPKLNNNNKSGSGSGAHVDAAARSVATTGVSLERDTEPAILDLMVAACEEDCEDLASYGYTLAVDLVPLGFYTSVWVRHQETFNAGDDEDGGGDHSDDALYDVGLLNAHEWFATDPNVFKLMKAYNFSEEDIYAFRNIYETLIDPESYVRVARVHRLLKLMDYKGNRIVSWLIRAVTNHDTDELKFSEYIHMVSFFSMFSQTEIIQFLYGCMVYDAEIEEKHQQMLNYNGLNNTKSVGSAKSSSRSNNNDGTDKNQQQSTQRTGRMKTSRTDVKTYEVNSLSREKFNDFIEYLSANTRNNVRFWQQEFDKFVDLSGTQMRLEGFQDFVRMHPRVLWETLHYQRTLKNFNFGEVFWEKKSEQFRMIRAEIGVKLHV